MERKMEKSTMSMVLSPFVSPPSSVPSGRLLFPGLSQTLFLTLRKVVEPFTWMLSGCSGGRTSKNCPFWSVLGVNVPTPGTMTVRGITHAGFGLGGRPCNVICPHNWADGVPVAVAVGVGVVTVVVAVGVWVAVLVGVPLGTVVCVPVWVAVAVGVAVLVGVAVDVLVAVAVAVDVGVNVGVGVAVFVGVAVGVGVLVGVLVGGASA